MAERVRGRAWRFGDSIDTDLMAPFGTFMESWERTRPQMFPNRPGVAMQIEPGDIIVAGRNWGCGSSREQAAGNLKKLGVAAVVAPSFARIFFRNAIAVGLPCLICPDVDANVSEGDLVEVDLAQAEVENLSTGVVLHGEPLTADMLRVLDAGGLLNTLSADERPAPRKAPQPLDARPKIMAEKILARAAGCADVRPGEYVTATVDRLVPGEFIASCVSRLRRIGITDLDASRVCQTITAVFPAPNAEVASLHVRVRRIAEELDIQTYFPHEGIMNQVIAEKGCARPGELILGGDSHSTMYGALGAAGAGLGITELAYVLAKGEIWLRTPETIRFELTGQPRPGVMSKDIMLHLLARFGGEYAQYKALEFGGPLADRMSVASRMTLSNMSVEMGAKFALFAADDATAAFLKDRVDGPIERLAPDPGANYAAINVIDVSDLEPQVARPHNPANGGPVSACAGLKVDQFFLGSCTNARLEDLEVAAAILRGRQVATGARLLVTPASREVMMAAMQSGALETLLAAGAHLTPPGCGACSGGVGGVIGPGEVCLSSTNRNFQGRMGSAEGQIYLASPATVAASAITGRITDPRELWPADAPDLLTGAARQPA